MKKYSALLPLLLLMFLNACTNENTNGGKTDSVVTPPKKNRVAGPVFNADSAYESVKTQVAFGPRIPGTPEHDKCAEYFYQKLSATGLKVEKQISDASSYDGRHFKMTNLFAQYKPERKDRILLLAHWDTRPTADLDPDSSLRKKTFDGADDGGSSSAMLLEVARIINQKDPNIGVDILLVDAEDMGDNGGRSETWCIGTQYWAQHMPSGYSARYGILLDMVGGRSPIFPREGTGVYFAPDVVAKVWSAAANLGYGNFFTNDVIGETTDDHLFINQYARIPCIDIVHYDPIAHDYPEWHHKSTDNMSIIEKSTLDMVGKVLIDVIYNEMPSN